MRTKTYFREQVFWSAQFKTNRTTLQEGYVRDVSADGLFMQLPSGIYTAKGLQAWVLMITPWKKTIEVVGTICWVDWNLAYSCYGFGLEFEAVNLEIDRYLTLRSDTHVVATSPPREQRRIGAKKKTRQVRLAAKKARLKDED